MSGCMGRMLIGAIDNIDEVLATAEGEDFARSG
jgi:hypothetical protein